MIIRSTAASRTCETLAGIAQDLETSLALVKAMPKGLRSAKTVDERIGLQVSLEMLVDNLLNVEETPSTESFKDTVINVIKAIIKKLKEGLNKVIDFFQSYVGTNIRNMERLHRNLVTSKNFNDFTSLILTDMSAYGLGFSKELGNNKQLDITEFSLPDGSVNAVNVDISTALVNSVKMLKDIPSNHSKVSRADSGNILAAIKRINVSVRPEVKGGRVIFNREDSAKSFHEKFPRGETTVVVHTKSYLKDFESWKRDILNMQKTPQMFKRHIAEIEREIESLAKSLSGVKEADNDNLNDHELMAELTSLLSIITAYQTYFLEAVNQSIRFNTGVVMALTSHFMSKHFYVSDDMVSIKVGNEEFSEELPVMSALSITGTPDEQLDIDTDFIAIQDDPIVIEDDSDFGLEGQDLVLYEGPGDDTDSAGTDKKFIDKVTEFLKKIGAWLSDRISKFSHWVFNRIATTKNRMEISRVFLVNSGIFKGKHLPDFIEVDMDKHYMAYGPLDKTGKFVPELLQMRFKGIEGVLFAVKELCRTYLNFTDINENYSGEAILTDINSGLSFFEQSFKGTSIETGTVYPNEKETSELNLPALTVKDNNQSGKVKASKVTIQLLTKSLGHTGGFKGLYKVLDQMQETSGLVKTSLAKSLAVTGANKISSLVSNNEDAKKLLAISQGQRAAFIKINSYMSVFMKCFDNLAASFFYLIRKINQGAQTPTASNEAITELTDYVTSAISRGGLTPHEAIAMNTASGFLKNNFGIEDFAIDTNLFLDKESRKEYSYEYLDKLSLAKTNHLSFVASLEDMDEEDSNDAIDESVAYNINDNGHLDEDDSDSNDSIDEASQLDNDENSDEAPEDQGDDSETNDSEDNIGEGDPDAAAQDESVDDDASEGTSEEQPESEPAEEPVEEQEEPEIEPEEPIEPTELTEEVPIKTPEESAVEVTDQEVALDMEEVGTLEDLREALVCTSTGTGQTYVDKLAVSNLRLSFGLEAFGLDNRFEIQSDKDRDLLVDCITDAVNRTTGANSMGY